MANVTLRNTPTDTLSTGASVKGSALTTLEMDDNLNKINQQSNDVVAGNTAIALNTASTAVTQAPADNSTKVATTAYADAAAAAASFVPLDVGVYGVGVIMMAFANVDTTSGSTVAGTNLSIIEIKNGAPAPSATVQVTRALTSIGVGTWRNISGHTAVAGTVSIDGVAALFQRIA